jgi:hypothetical protein
VATDASFGPRYCVAGNNGKGTTIFKVTVYNTIATVSVSLQLECDKKGTTAMLTVLTGAQSPCSYNDPSSISSLFLLDYRADQPHLLPNLTSSTQSLHKTTLVPQTQQLYHTNRGPEP